MRQIKCVMCFALVVTAVCGCQKNQAQPETAVGNVGSQPLDEQVSAVSEADNAQVSEADNSQSADAGAAKDVTQNRAVPKSCDAFESKMADPSQWGCVDGIPVCTNIKGCLADGRLYPEWGYLGDTAPRLFPKLPADFESYGLYDGYSDFKMGKDPYWVCKADKCMCGNRTLSKYGSCNGDIAYLKYKDKCGDQQCGSIYGGCQNDKCVCGNVLFDEVASDPEEVKKYSCEKNHRMSCNSINGCACGSVKCIDGAYCKDGRCFCGDDDVTDVSLDYSCRDRNDYGRYLQCRNYKGCLCGEKMIPGYSECKDGTGYCHGKPIPTDGIPDITKYECRKDEPMFVCHSIDGCACGDNKCVSGSECYNGECYCGKKKVKFDWKKHPDAYPECEEGVLYTSGSGPDSDHDPEYDYEYYGKYKDTNERRCPSLNDDYISCTDCDDLTCEYRDWDDHDRIYHEWICRVYHGCTYNGKSYRYGERVKIQSEVVETKICGGEKLRDNYICKSHQQVCNASAGCKCGDSDIAQNAVCSMGTISSLKTIKKNTFCACDSNDSNQHCPALELTEDDLYDDPQIVNCGGRSLKYKVDMMGNDDDTTDIPVSKDMFDACCVCLNDEKIPEDFENYLCKIEFNPEKSAKNDNVRLNVKGIKFVPYVESWTCYDTQKCTAKAACELGKNFEYIDDNTCKCGDLSLDPRSVGRYKCFYGVVLCNSARGCTKPGTDEKCKYGKICM